MSKFSTRLDEFFDSISDALSVTDCEKAESLIEQAEKLEDTTPNTKKYYCPHCGSEQKGDLLPSKNIVFCFTCQKFHSKHLKEGQKSVLIHHLVGGQEK